MGHSLRVGRKRTGAVLLRNSPAQRGGVRWYHGYGNAFGVDADRMLVHGSRRSVGLGGNISKSLASLKDLEPPPPAVDMVGEDAGNGSLMRLAPVPILFQVRACVRPSVCRFCAETWRLWLAPPVRLGRVSAPCLPACVCFFWTLTGGRCFALLAERRGDCHARCP
jgi:hypothetical protein